MLARLSDLSPDRVRTLLNAPPDRLNQRDLELRSQVVEEVATGLQPHEDPRHPPSLVLRDAKGAASVDARRKGERFGWLRLQDYPLNILPGRTEPSAFYVPTGGQGDFQCEHIAAEANAPFLVEFKLLTEAGCAWDLQNGPIHHNFIFGTAEEPLRLTVPMLMQAGLALQIRATSLATTVTLALRAAAHGRFFSEDMDPAERKKASEAAKIKTVGERPYWLGLDPLNGTTAFTLTALQQRAQYFMTMPFGFKLVVERPPLIESTGPVQIELSDRNDGRSLTPDGAIDSELIAARGEHDDGLFGGLVFHPGQSIRVNITDVSGAANAGYFALFGRMVPC